MSLVRSRLAVLAAAVAMGMGLLMVPGVSAAQATSADLAVSVTPQNRVITLYQIQFWPIQFTATVVNYGPTTANNVVLTETISGWLQQSTVKVSAPMPCTVANPSNRGFTVTCTQSSLPSGGTDKVTVTFNAFVMHGVPRDSLSAAVSSATPDPNAANNTASGTISFSCLTFLCYLR
jgi:hypothetical protein